MISKILAVPAMAVMATLSGQALAAGGHGDWTRADRNHDGQVMYREAMGYAQDSFRRADRNGDGILTGRELRGLDDGVVNVDYNRDGRINFFEYRTAVRNSFASADRSRDGVLSGYELHGRQAESGYWRR